LVKCRYDPSSINVILDGVFIHSPLGSFPLLLFEDYSNSANMVVHFVYWAIGMSRGESMVDACLGCSAKVTKDVTTDKSWCDEYVYECLGEVRRVV
jgi:hypothetical protein